MIIIITNIIKVKLILDLNFSFDAILLMYEKIINKPPIIIKKVIIMNQDEYIVLFIKIIISIVCVINANPIDIGFFRNGTNVLIIIIIFIIITFISACSLYKNLNFGSLRSINLLCWCFKKHYFNFDLQGQYFT